MCNLFLPESKKTSVLSDWKSSNEKVAQIDAVTGEIYGVKAGTVTITASAKDGSGKRDTVRVVVQKP